MHIPAFETQRNVNAWDWYYTCAFGRPVPAHWSLVYRVALNNFCVTPCILRFSYFTSFSLMRRGIVDGCPLSECQKCHRSRLHVSDDHCILHVHTYNRCLWWLKRLLMTIYWKHTSVRTKTRPNRRRRIGSQTQKTASRGELFRRTLYPVGLVWWHDWWHRRVQRRSKDSQASCVTFSSNALACGGIPSLHLDFNRLNLLDRCLRCRWKSVTAVTFCHSRHHSTTTGRNCTSCKC